MKKIFAEKMKKNYFNYEIRRINLNNRTGGSTKLVMGVRRYLIFTW